MKIVLVTDELDTEPIGGIGRLVGSFAEAARELGHQTTVVLVTEGGGEALAGPDPPDLVRCSYTAGGSIAERAVRRARAVAHAYRTIEEHGQVDLALAPVWNTPGLALVEDPMVPLVSMVVTPLRVAAGFHPGAATHPDVLVQADLEDRVIRASAAIHLLSPSVGSTIAHLTDGVPVFVAPMPSSLRPPEGADLALPGSPGCRRMLLVGRPEPRKGVDVLIEAFGMAADVLGPDALRLDMAGDDTPRLPGGGRLIDQLAGAYGDRPWWRHVAFHGYASDAELQQRLLQADVVCIPSRYESQGLVALEALSFGRPLIVTDTGGLADVVDDNGWVVPPGDTPALAEALVEVATHTSLQALGTRSLERSAEYHPTALVERFLDQAIGALTGRGPIGPQRPER